MERLKDLTSKQVYLIYNRSEESSRTSILVSHHNQKLTYLFHFLINRNLTAIDVFTLQKLTSKDTTDSMSLYLVEKTHGIYSIVYQQQRGNSKTVAQNTLTRLQNHRVRRFNRDRDLV